MNDLKSRLLEAIDRQEIDTVGWPTEHAAVKAQGTIVDPGNYSIAELGRLGIHQTLTDSQIESILKFLMEDNSQE